MAVALVLLNALAISVGNVLGGVSARRMRLSTLMMIAGPTSVAVALVYAVLLTGEASIAGLAIGVAAGLLGGAGIPMAYAAYARGPVGVVGSVVALTTTVLIALAGVITGEALSPLRAVGLTLCLAAVLLVTHAPRGRDPVALRAIVLALSAAVLFSVFVILLDRASAAHGLWPLVAARIGVSVVALTMFAVQAVRLRHTARPVPLGRLALLPVIVGFLDVTGNLFLVLALQAGDLLLLAILAPAAPIFTAVIGRLFLGESLRRTQIVGLMLASAALPFAAL